MVECPYCGSSEVDYMGVTDGAGAYGDALADLYLCGGCGEFFEGLVFPIRFGDDCPDDMPDMPEPSRWWKLCDHLRWRWWQVRRALRLTNEELPF